MTIESQLHIPGSVHKVLWQHLLSGRSEPEEAAFLFARRTNHDVNVFDCIDWYAIPSSGFISRSEYHLELTDEARAYAIKRAHDLDASLVEFHSHRGPWSAAFSSSDHLGFEEFVPHVWWRLKGKPYLAVVVTESDFDGLIWITDPHTAQHLDSIVVDGTVHKPTQLSALRIDGFDHEMV